MAASYVVKVLNRTTHAVIATLANANVDWVEAVLNDTWSASFHMHTLDPDAYTYLAPNLLVQREVQIWRDSVCVFWGIPLDARANMSTVTFPCVGLLWYYSRRLFGPIQNHYGTNVDFEAGTTGWTAAGGVTFTVSPTWRALGTQSAKLVSTAANADAYITQSHTTTTTAVPVFFAFKALFHVVGAGWVGPALEERGLYLEVRNSANVLVAGPVWEPLTSETPRDASKPYRLETGITVPAGLTNAVVHRRIYSPGGTIYVDATDIVTLESVGSSVTGDQAATILARYHNYSQDAAQGKSNEDITVNTPGTYTSLVRTKQFFDNGNVLAAMKELSDENLLDFEVTWNPLATTRALETWTKKGTLKAANPVTFGVNTLGDFDYSVSGGAVTTSARVLGQGDGADREIGLAVDTSQLGGLVLESSRDAPAETPIDGLQRLADADLAASKAPVILPEFTVPTGDLIPAVGLGDTVAVTANYGYVQEATNRRLVSYRIDAKADTVTPRFNV